MSSVLKVRSAGEIRTLNCSHQMMTLLNDARSVPSGMRQFWLPFEGAWAAEVDAHLINEVAICPNAGFRYEIDVIFLPGPDVEVVFKEKRALEDFNGTLAVMDRIARIGVGKGACRDRRRILFDGELLQRFQRWENIRKQEETDGHPKSGAEYPTDKEYCNTAPHRPRIGDLSGKCNQTLAAASRRHNLMTKAFRRTSRCAR